MNWIDAVAFAFLAFSAWNGWRRGLISELFGFLALVAAGLAAFAYRGQLDGVTASTMHLGPGSAHVAGVIAFAALGYLAVWSVGFVADRIAKLPLLNLINGALGGALAVVKTVALLAVVDYVATLAPMSQDLRGDLHASVTGRTLNGIDASIDDSVGRSLPGYLQPFWQAAMHRRDDAAVAGG